MASGLAIGVGSILLPFLLKQMGKKVLPRAARVVGKAGARAAAKRGARGLTTAGGKAAALNLGSKGLRSLGSATNSLGNLGILALPFGLGLGGKLVQGAGTAGGAAVSAIGSIPGALNLTPQAKRDLYGGTPMDSVSDISRAIGDAAGLGLSTVAGALGSSANEISNALRLNNYQNALSTRAIQDIKNIQRTGAPPSAVNLAGQLLRTGGHQ